MKTISLKNADGETIEVKRGEDGIIPVRHCGKDTERFGEFNTVAMLSKEPAAWEFLAKNGVYINSEAGKEALKTIGALGFLRIDEEQILIGPDDGQLICDAIKQLDPKAGESSLPEPTAELR
jgi:hypothetical protein